MLTNNLVKENMNLVYHIIHKEYPTFARDEDIVQSGLLGLVKAANTWDSKLAKFSTYAARCIRNEIYQEFKRRKRSSTPVSLDAIVGDNSRLEELVCRDDQTINGIVEHSDFCDKLSNDELTLLNMYKLGYDTTEVSEITGYNIQKVRQIYRSIKRRARDYYGNFS